jgi:hypothetical protein
VCLSLVLSIFLSCFFTLPYSFLFSFSLLISFPYPAARLLNTRRCCPPTTAGRAPLPLLPHGESPFDGVEIVRPQGTTIQRL